MRSGSLPPRGDRSVMDTVQPREAEKVNDANNRPPKNSCQQCQEQPFKYTCPRCGLRTCSLVCVKSHKIDFSCDGIRDKTAYVPVDGFKDIHLLSDYRLLEDVARVAEHRKRDHLMKQHRKPPFLQYLTKEAHKRNIRFRSMPYPMHRRKNNSSIYNRKLDAILWDITWVFPKFSVLHTEKRISEKLLVSEAFQKIFDPTTGNPIFLHKLKAYRTVDINTLCFYMKQELKSQQITKYYNLQTEESLKDNLYGKCVLEHPVIHVLFPEETSEYPLVPEPAEKPKSKEICQPQVNLPESECGKDKSEAAEEKDEDSDAAPEELPILKTENSAVS